jgi:hypothetical protein
MQKGLNATEIVHAKHKGGFAMRTFELGRLEGILLTKRCKGALEDGDILLNYGL